MAFIVKKAVRLTDRQLRTLNCFRLWTAASGIKSCGGRTEASLANRGLLVVAKPTPGQFQYTPEYHISEAGLATLEKYRHRVQELL